jgi:K+-transporting ATPase ATPase C chain
MKQIAIGFKLFILMTILTGVLYPVIVTVLGQVIFKNKATGSFVQRGQQIIGSELIAQKFATPRYFWGRPSATDYNPLPSGGSNLGPTSQALKKSVDERTAQIQKAHHLDEHAAVPADLVFASASGLDPEVSPEAAVFQVERVAEARALSSDQEGRLRALIKAQTVPPQLGFLGQPRVNVLELNLALDTLTGQPERR